MQKILVVVDMQNDFIDGALGTTEAAEIVKTVAKRVNEFEGRIYFTRDTHGQNYRETKEGRELPIPHCIKDSYGWQISSLIDTSSATAIIDKPTFGSTELVEMMKSENEREEIESITVIGVCTDICVISNVMLLKAYFPEIEIIVDAQCCAGVTAKSHKTAISAMKMCQVTVENE